MQSVQMTATHHIESDVMRGKKGNYTHYGERDHNRNAKMRSENFFFVLSVVRIDYQLISIIKLE